MSNKLVKLKFHGELGKIVNPEWELAASSLGDCIRLVEMNSKKLYKTLLEFDKKLIKYCVIINGRNFQTDKKLDIDDLQSIKTSELALQSKNLETVDIIPVLEGANSDILGIFTAILGAILIVVGAVFGFNPGLIMAGITLLAGGVFSLLARPPKFEDFREIEQGGKTSYLFSGPQNVIGEGGPVPMGYGLALVGSQTISSSYVIRDFSTADSSLVLRDEFGNMTFLAKKHKTFWEQLFDDLNN